MPIPANIRAQAPARVALFCDNRIPDHNRDDVRLEHRPPATPSPSSSAGRHGEKASDLNRRGARSPNCATRRPRGGGRSTGADPNGRWLRYDRIPPATDETSARCSQRSAKIPMARSGDDIVRQSRCRSAQVSAGPGAERSFPCVCSSVGRGTRVHHRTRLERVTQVGPPAASSGRRAGPCNPCLSLIAGIRESGL